MKNLVASFLVLLFVFACASDGDNSNSEPVDYDRTGILTNWANNIILPSFENYKQKVQVFSTDLNAFTENPTTSNLATARNSWVSAYESYQYVALFDIGKAKEILFKEKTNTFPANFTKIESNIQSGSFDFVLYSVQGFPALDYLLNGLGGTDEEVIAFYTSNTNAANYKKYVVDVTKKLLENATLIENDWKKTYLTSFISDNSNKIGSPFSTMINAFTYNLEKEVRASKVGIPAGVFSNNVTYPNQTEAFYSGKISKQLLIASVKASQDFFNGKHFNSSQTGLSLKSYLDFLKNNGSGKDLGTIIDSQYNTILSTIQNLNDNLSQQVTTNNGKMIETYQSLQQNVIYIKLDLFQALNITVEYVDADGD
jgi:predicted lipoprotein